MQRWKQNATKRLIQDVAQDTKHEFRDAADALRENDFPITLEEAKEILSLAGFDPIVCNKYKWSSSQSCKEFEIEQYRNNDYRD